jgi:multiple sugar transport system permease protein
MTATTTRPVLVDERATSTRRKRRIRRPSVFQVLMIVAGLTWLVPIIWMLVLSVSSNHQLQLGSKTLVPKGFTLSNLINELEDPDLRRWFLNSVIVTGVTTIGTVALCAMAGYAFGRMEFRFKRFLFILTLTGLMMPREALFIPLYLIFSRTNQLNTYQALALPRIALPLGVFIMTQFFRAVPVELEDAAYIDGAGQIRMFTRIMLPLARPAMAALAIFAFIQSWNDYLWPLVVATDSHYFTLTVGLASQDVSFTAAQTLGDLMARGVIGSLPLVIVFLIFQRQLIRGIALGSGEK